MIGWQVGQQLVCIEGFPEAKPLGFKAPEIGDVVTIASIHICCFSKELGIQIEEIPLQRHSCGAMMTFDACRFRPVKPTSLDCFQYHLIRAPDLELTK